MSSVPERSVHFKETAKIIDLVKLFENLKTKTLKKIQVL
jgi:hypothetical protein